MVCQTWVLPKVYGAAITMFVIAIVVLHFYARVVATSRTENTLKR